MLFWNISSEFIFDLLDQVFGESWLPDFKLCHDVSKWAEIDDTKLVDEACHFFMCLSEREYLLFKYSLLKLNSFRWLISILVLDPFFIQELVINLESLDPFNCPWLWALRVDLGVEFVVLDG